MKNEYTAIEQADGFIQTLLTTQPELLRLSTVDAESGKNLGDFISALRTRLAEEYRQKN